MQTDEFLINELARQAGVTTRTIRYYTDESLLPPPMIKGKYAYYNQTHLDRLRLVLRLKATYLPLREIKQAINALTDQEVADQLQNAQPASPSLEFTNANPTTSQEKQSPGSGARALEYISLIMTRQSDLRSSYQSITPPVMPGGPPLPPPQARSKLTPAPAPTAPAAPETWRRIPLALGVELHLREPASAQDADAINQLLAFARQLFTNLPKEK